MSVQFKPLEWREYEHEGDADQWDAETMFGTFYGIRLIASEFRLEHDYTAIGAFQGPDEAKAAAQADYENRILSALLTPSPLPAGAEAGSEGK